MVSLCGHLVTISPVRSRQAAGFPMKDPIDATLLQRAQIPEHVLTLAFGPLVPSLSDHTTLLTFSPTTDKYSSQILRCSTTYLWHLYNVVGPTNRSFIRSSLLVR